MKFISCDAIAGIIIIFCELYWRYFGGDDHGMDFRPPPVYLYHADYWYVCRPDPRIVDCD